MRPVPGGNARAGRLCPTLGAIQVLGVNVKDQASAALALLAKLDVHYPSVYDSAEAVQRALRVPRVLPVSYLVRPDGTVRRITKPLVFRTVDELRAAIKRHLPSRE